MLNKYVFIYIWSGRGLETMATKWLNFDGLVLNDIHVIWDAILSGVSYLPFYFYCVKLSWQVNIFNEKHGLWYN